MHYPLLKIALIVEVREYNVLMFFPISFCFVFVLLPVACHNICFGGISSYKYDPLPQLQVRLRLSLLRRGITANQKGSAEQAK